MATQRTSYFNTARSASTSQRTQLFDDTDSYYPDGYAQDEDEEEFNFGAGDDADEDLEPAPKQYYPGIDVCIVCEERPPYSSNGRSYPTCGLRCKGILEQVIQDRAASTSSSAPASPSASPRRPFHRNNHQVFNTLSPTQAGGSSRSGRRGGSTTANDLSRQISLLSLQGKATGRNQTNRKMALVCVVCRVKECRDGRYVTCGIVCAEKLCKDGSADPNMCTYCHRLPKMPGINQCGPTCIEKAKTACLLCKSRPKYKRYHLCGRTCKQIATKATPLILEAPAGHTTYDFVERKFKDAWKAPSNPIPAIKHIYKIIESASFLQPYDRYKQTVGNEVFRYHGTTRKCTLGTAGNRQLCSNTTCALCCILRTSFKTSLANPSGAFGPGVYSSSASNKAYSYTSSGSGAILLTKVILGNVRTVQAWNEVMSCPPGFNSVVFDRQNGTLNETIVYSDDAIRPVFLIVF